MPAVVEQRFPGKATQAAEAPPASLLQWPLWGDEHLLVQAWNIHPTDSAIVTIAGRFFSEASQDIDFFSQRITALPTASATTIQIPFTRGALLSIRISSDTLPAGNVYARAVFSKGFSPIAALTFPATILQGYIGLSQDLAWPGSPIQLASDGPGVIRTVAGVKVAQSFFFVVPPNRRWRIVTAFMIVVNDATVGNRRVDVFATTAAAAILFVAGSIVFQTASQACAYSCAPGTQAQIDISTGRQMLPFPIDLPLRGGDGIQLALVPVSVFDDVSAGQATVREWYDPDTP